MISSLRALLVLVAAGSLGIPPAIAGDINAARDLVNKANYLMAARKFPEALKTYEEALKHDPGNGVIKNNIVLLHNNWGRFYTSQKKYREAQAEFQKCLELQPGYYDAKRNLGLLKRYAEDEGVDIDAPPDAPPGSPGSDIPIPPSGVDAPRPKDGSQQAKVAPEHEAGAVLFIGGVKQQTQPQPPPANLPPPVDAYPIGATSAPPMVSPVGAAAPPASSGATIYTPAQTAPQMPVSPQPQPQQQQPTSGASIYSAPANDFTARPQNPLFPVTPNQFPQMPTQQPAAAAAPVQIVPTAATGTLDEQLTAVELKVYGAKQANLTVLQRLEKIERDAAGQIRVGTISERIEYLKKSFGL